MDTEATVNHLRDSPPDLSHHLSSEARNRLPNPMKEIMRLTTKLTRNNPEVISLANGDPHHSLHPIHKVEFQIPLVTESEGDPVPTWRKGESAIQTLCAYKDSYDDPNAEPSVLNLSSAFGYTHGAGLPEAQQTLTGLARLFHGPLPNHVVTLTVGNSDGVTKVFRLLGEKGDYFLTDEFSFPGMTNAPLAYGVKWVGVRMDEGGLIPEHMESILRDWDAEVRGKRPHVLYIVPCGQNPTGSTLNLERRKKIYDIASRWDLIIIEDDPYFFLQYDLPSIEVNSTASFSHCFAQSLVKSFLSMDVEGRVIRVDGFSKILSPGMRLGWITSNSFFHHKLVMYTDSAVQHPHAFGQVFITEMFSKRGWESDGFARWLSSLCKDYQRRRDLLLDVFRREVEPLGYASVNHPQAGMFVWVEVHIHLHPRYRILDKQSSDLPAANLPPEARTNISELMDELFHKLVASNLIVMPAALFAIHEVSLAAGSARVPIIDRVNFFRMTFCGTEETISLGIARFGQVLKSFFEDGKGS